MNLYNNHTNTRFTNSISVWIYLSELVVFSLKAVFWPVLHIRGYELVVTDIKMQMKNALKYLRSEHYTCTECIFVHRTICMSKNKGKQHLNAIMCSYPHFSVISADMSHIRTLVVPHSICKLPFWQPLIDFVNTPADGVQSLHPLDVTPLVFTPSKPGRYTSEDID